MKPQLVCRLFALNLLLASPAAFTADSEGCKDHPLFTRMPNMVIAECKASEFDAKTFPVGAPPKRDGADTNKPREVAIEGAYTYLVYSLDAEKEGVKKPSGVQIMRNFEAATQRAGGTVEGKYPAWCNSGYPESLNPGGNTCTNNGVSMRFKKGNSETRAYMNVSGEGEGYELWIVEAKAMAQDIAANEVLDQINQSGFVTVYINFDTGKASIKKDSAPQLAQIADALKQADMKLEVAGHTDNQGESKANQKLSHERAKAVVAALAALGVNASRLTPMGYGQDKPVADNRSEEGRAKNRRVELVKK